MPPQPLPALCFGAAGLGLYLMLLNRRLIMIRDSRIKAPLLATIGAAMILLPAWLAPGLDRGAWIAAPAGILGLIALGEARRHRIRRRCAGERPVFDEPSSPLVTTTSVRTATFGLEVAGWGGRPFRIVQISDLHVTDALPFSYFEGVMERVDALRPDLLLVTGDMVTDVRCTPLLARMLRPVGSCGSFAILGNHDYWAGPEAVADAIGVAGLKLLRNGTCRVALGGGNVVLSGCEDPWSPRPWRRPPMEPGDLLVVLSHTPDNVYALSRAGAHLVFSGHLHAGQIRIPRLGPLVVPSIYGRRFDHGHFVVDGTNLFVTAGIGAADPPLRVNCPPDIFVVDVAPAAARGARPAAASRRPRVPAQEPTPLLP